MKKLLLLLILAITTVSTTFADTTASQPDEEYYPFVEQGKTWKYNEKWFKGLEPFFDCSEYCWEYRIEDAVEINGEQWYKLNRYQENWQGKLVFYETEGYLRDDIPEKKVWIRFEWGNGPKEPELLYDFKTGMGFYSGWNAENLEEFYEKYIILDSNHIFEAADGSKRKSIAFQSDGYSKHFMVTPGLGLLIKESKCNELDDEKYIDAGSTILEILSGVNGAVMGYSSSMLYEVTSGDGTVLYTHDAYRPKKYYPFVEQGKTWKYQQKGYHDDDPTTDFPDNYLWEYRIEDAVGINGEVWHKLNLYTENRKGEMRFHRTQAYLRENIALNRVWVKFGTEPEEEPQLFYDFVDGFGFYSPVVSEIDFTHDCISDTEHIFEAADGSKRRSVALKFDGDHREFMVTQGLGLLIKESKCNELNDFYEQQGGTIFDIQFMMIGVYNHSYSQLYEITAGDGTVLYTHDAYRRRTTDGVDATPADKVEMVLEGKQIKLSAPAAIGRVMVFDASGCMIRDFDLSQSTFAIDTTGYMPGLYIVKAGSETLKVTVN